MASRSLHRSQDMGQLQEPGPKHTAVGWVEGGAGRSGKELFSGVDTRLRAMAAEVGDPARREPIEKRLDAVEASVAETRRRASTPGLASAVPALARDPRRSSARARGLVAAGDGGAAMLLDEKIVLAAGRARLRGRGARSTRSPRARSPLPARPSRSRPPCGTPGRRTWKSGA